MTDNIISILLNNKEIQKKMLHRKTDMSYFI